MVAGRPFPVCRWRLVPIGVVTAFRALVEVPFGHDNKIVFAYQQLQINRQLV